MREKIGDYEIDPLFKPRVGVFGTTFRATHPMFPERFFAVKLIRNVDERGVSEFLHEVRTLDRLHLSSEHIVLFRYAGFTDEGEPYCVMEFCDGGDLDELSLKLGGLDPADIAEIGRQACLGLREAHRHDYIHRDIKPSNLMLGRMADGHYGVKLIDFGVARAVNNPQRSAGGREGKLLFASPEQIKGEALDMRSDLYSLGVTLWYVLLGGPPPPLSSDVRGEVEAQHVDFQNPFDFSEIHPALMAIFEGLMAKPREHRTETIETALEHFESAVVGLRDNYQLYSNLDGVVAGRKTGVKPLPPEFSPPVKLDFRSDEYYTDVLSTGMETAIGTFRQMRRHDGYDVGVVSLKGQIPDAELDLIRRELKSLTDQHVQAQQESNYPDAIIRPLSFHWFGDGEVAVESEWADGIYLKDLLQSRGRFRFRETVPLLAQMAEAADFCQQRELPGVSMDEAQVLLSFSDPVTVEDLSGMAPSEWPMYSLKLTPLNFKDPELYASFASSGEDDIQQTRDTDAPAALIGCSPLSIFSSRIYRMVSGKPVAQVAFSTGYGYSNTAALSAESNNLLRDRIASGKSEAGGSCLEFLRAICEYEGAAPPEPGRPRGTRSATPPARIGRPPDRNPAAAAADSVSTGDTEKGADRPANSRIARRNRKKVGRPWVKTTCVTTGVLIFLAAALAATATFLEIPVLDRFGIRIPGEAKSGPALLRNGETRALPAGFTEQFEDPHRGIVFIWMSNVGAWISADSVVKGSDVAETVCREMTEKARQATPPAIPDGWAFFPFGIDGHLVIAPAREHGNKQAAAPFPAAPQPVAAQRTGQPSDNGRIGRKAAGRSPRQWGGNSAVRARMRRENLTDLTGIG